MMEDENKFYSLWKKYLEIISPKYQVLEKNRLKEIKKFFIESILVFIGAFIIVFLISWSKTSPIDACYLIACCFFACIPAVIWAKICMKSYGFDLKNFAMEPLLRIFGDEIYHDQYSLKSSEPFLLDNENLRKSELFFEFNEIEFDDIIYGNYNNTKFTVAEADMTMASNKNAIGIFKGIILAYQIKKHSMSNTILATKNVLTRNNSLMKVFLSAMSMLSLTFIIGILEAICQNEYYILIISAILLIAIMLICLPMFITAKKKGYYKTFKNVTLEDIKFNKRYKIYSSDQIEARYFLTPAFMERFYNLEKIFKAKNIKCSFYEDRLIIAIDTKKDLFEIGSLFKPLKDSKTIRRFYEEINGIFDVINVLKLDR